MKPKKKYRKKSSSKDKKSNAKNKNKKMAKMDSFTSSIADRAAQREEKYESDEDGHFKSEHYLKIDKKTSNHKFTNIDCLEPQEYIPLKLEAMRNPTNHRLKQKLLDKWRREDYEKWIVELKTGFNLLFYGVGSKKHVLEDFGKTFCCADPKGIVIRVNGFFDDLTIKQILDALCGVIIDKDKIKKSKKNEIKTDKDIEKRAMHIIDYLNDERTRNNLKFSYFYLIIHNITGTVLRKKKIQRIFACLAHCRYIHLIASIDHIHSLLLWDRNDLALFHWIYHEITTYKHYFEEMEFEKNTTIKIQNSSNHGLEHIMSSLTPQHRDIIQVLAEHQNDHNGNGLDESMWYDLCEEMLYVSNKLKFEQYLNEFKDHNVIILDTVKGNQMYKIPYSKEIIQNNLIDYNIND